MTKISLEVVNFDRELKRIEEEIRQLSNIEIEERIDYATDQLRIVTPVDTGKARKGWFNRKFKNVLNRRFSEGVIENPVEYVPALNQGHSKQAPRYFIEQVLSKIGILTPN